LLEAGVPTTTLTSPRRLLQTPSFNVSLGHFCDVEGVGGLVVGVVEGGGVLVVGVEGVGGGLALGVDGVGGGLALGVVEGGGGQGVGFFEGGGGLGLGFGLHDSQACENMV